MKYLLLSLILTIHFQIIITASCGQLGQNQNHLNYIMSCTYCNSNNATYESFKYSMTPLLLLTPYENQSLCVYDNSTYIGYMSTIYFNQN
jgi:hypothetical protein